jgi:hypothetical protein
VQGFDFAITQALHENRHLPSRHGIVRPEEVISVPLQEAEQRHFLNSAAVDTVIFDIRICIRAELQEFRCHITEDKRREQKGISRNDPDERLLPEFTVPLFHVCLCHKFHLIIP